MRKEYGNNAEFAREYCESNQLLAAIDERKEFLSSCSDIRELMEGEKGKPAMANVNWGVGALAMACLVMFVYIGHGWMFGQPTEVNAPPVKRYVTGVGEIKTINLEDGSTITLNTSSEILVVMTENLRQIVLRRGEGYFDVSKDIQRPFSVDLQGRSISVLGTEFNVRRYQAGFEISLVEGSVLLHRQEENMDVSAPAVNPEADEPVHHKADQQVRMLPNTELVFDSEEKMATVSRVDDLGRQLSWKKGILSFNGEPLKKVVSELNRYSGKKIVLEDQQLGSQKIFATLSTNEIGVAISGLERVAPIKIIPSVNKIVIVSSENF
ncbi:FecR domain-containing protein [Porticoccus sp. W117]|uniref:FecR family protein n=1 Tax=Porticoccus sp. W117 TaxID=3054777 RepID=UPI00259AB538|nr:FecR domain-containing protein [Porticoccus sp. W117]MDM3870340.1 FecR domain-containing protein [Porticoccus sp. W117]